VFWSRISDVEEKMNGAPPEKVIATRFVIGGHELTGGYYPIAYDSDKSFKAFRFESKNAVDMLETNAYAPQTQRGHTMERVKASRELKLKLGTDVLYGHITNAAHDVTHTLPVVDAYRLINHPTVRDTVTKKMGAEFYRQMTPWLQAIANDTRAAQSQMTNFLSGYLKNSVTLAIMGYKVSTALVQPLGITVSADVISKGGAHGVQYIAKGMKTLDPTNIGANLAFMQARSVMMRTRVETYDREMRDMMRSSEQNPLKHKLIKNSMMLTAGTDMGVSMVTWYAAYQQAMMGDANDIALGDEVAAVQYADMAVRLSQGSGIAMDLSFIQREGGLTRLLTMFGSYWNVLLNAAMERADQAGHARLGALGLLGSVGLLWIAPMVMETMMRDMFRSEDGEDDEERNKRYLFNAVTYPFQTIPVVNSLVRSAAGKVLDQPFSDFQLSPVESALAALTRAPMSIIDIAENQGDAKRNSVKNLVDLTGYFTGLPTSQAWATSSYIYDLGKENETTDSAWRMLGGTVGMIPYDDRKTTGGSSE
jgi:hypothetical protein